MKALNYILGYSILVFLAISKLHAQNISYSPWLNLTEQRNMPPEVVLQHSNNNLDIIKFQDKYYVAFRTAPTHFASKKAMLYIISSTDLKTWKYEYTIAMKSDLREPRFAILKDSLYLYYFRGGTKMLKFEPKEVLVTVTKGNKDWTAPSTIGIDGYVPWRLRNKDNKLFLSAYYGKELYNSKHQSDLRLLSSTDGRHFTRLSDKPQINIKTAEEGEFIFDRKEDLYATVRLEGSGSLICKAEKDSLEKWKFKRYKYKYDSALLFAHNDDIYLISRRNMDGPIDKTKDTAQSAPKIETTQYESLSTNEIKDLSQNKDSTLPMKPITIQQVDVKDKKAKKVKDHRNKHLIRYSFTRKRTALFKFDKENLNVEPILDFPSTGDCSYPAIQQMNEHEYLVMNYSSDIHKKEKNWIRGQLGKTYIYWTILKFQ